MADESVVLEHSIEADVSLAFAWAFRTDVATWDDPPATFQLDGPFAEDSRGMTLLPGQEPGYFRAVSEQRTKLTQRIVLSGSDAAAYRQQVEAGFGTNLAAGMAKVAASMAAAANETGADRTGRTSKT